MLSNTHVYVSRFLDSSVGEFLLDKRVGLRCSQGVKRRPHEEPFDINGKLKSEEQVKV